MDNRMHSVDAARALFLLLGIPYHFATLSIFDAKVHASDLLVSPMVGLYMSSTHAFRMFAFFVLAGYFSALIIERRGKNAWIIDRLERLAVPLIASMLSVLVVGRWLELYYSGRSFDIQDYNILNFSHLWFLVVLLLFAGALYLLAERLRFSQLVVAKAILLRGRPGAVFVGLLAIWGLGRSALDIGLDHVKLPFESILSHFLLHVPAFAIGVAARTGTVRERLFTLIRPRQYIAVAAFLAIYIALDPLARPSIGLPDSKTFVEKLISNSIELPVAYFTSLAVFSFLSKIVVKKNLVIDYFVSGALAIYIFHIMWVHIVVHALDAYILPAEVRFVVGSALVLALSTMCYAVTRLNPWLSAAFNGTKLPRRSKAAVV